MAVTLKEDEGIPAEYPTVAATLSDAAVALDAAAIWQRIESYCAHRWTPRQVVWIAEGPGEWLPPISPASIATGEIWISKSWTACALDAGPLGGIILHSPAQYRIIANVGGGDLPPAVAEAFRRLAEYLADEPDRAGVSSYSVNLGSAISESYSRNPAWSARALDLSGAADLLRPWKRRF